jgi:hypothetical protein
MAAIDDVMRENYAAVEDLAAAGERCSATWTTPRAPGKWSPSQVVEHVARALEDSARALNGQPTRFPVFPAFLRPLIRVAFLRQVLKRGRFGRAKTNKAMDPESGPGTPVEGRVRLERAMREYDDACRSHAKTSPTFESTIFGTVSLVDYSRFQVLHTMHHRKQLPS